MREDAAPVSIVAVDPGPLPGACEEGEISLLEPPVSNRRRATRRRVIPTPSTNRCPDAGVGGASGRAGASGTAGATRGRRCLLFRLRAPAAAGRFATL